MLGRNKIDTAIYPMLLDIIYIILHNNLIIKVFAFDVFLGLLSLFDGLEYAFSIRFHWVGAIKKSQSGINIRR